MSDKPKKRIEIEAAIKASDPETLKKVESELDFMEVSEGLENKNNLDQFYGIWKTYEGEIGHKNDIHSWTAYAIGMTSAKPDGDFIPMRRAFARAGFPDVDADFDDERRGEVYEYLIDKWGRENVGNIGTYQSLKMKAAVTRISKAVDAAEAFHKGPEANRTDNFQLANEISSTLPVLPTGVIKVKGPTGDEIVIKKAREAYKHVPDFRAYMDRHPSILKHCDNIEGLVGKFGCLCGESPVLTDMGWVLLKEVSPEFHKVGYIDENGEICFTNKFRQESTGRKKTFNIRLSNGASIRATKDHILFTEDGPKEIKELDKGDKIYFCK